MEKTNNGGTYKRKNVCTSDRVLDIVKVIILGIVVIVTVYPFWNVFIVSINDATDSLSRKDLVGGKFFNMLFIFTMYFGGGLVPYYMTLKNMHLLNSFWVYIIPMMMSVYNMILVKNYMAPIYYEGGSVPIKMDGKIRFLAAPFDNDKWARFVDYPILYAAEWYEWGLSL